MKARAGIVLEGLNLTPEQLVGVARGGEKVFLNKGVERRISASREMLEKWIKEEKIVYGVTTGFGPFVSVLIPTKYQSQLQHNLIRSHSANVGPLFSREEVRAAMTLRVNAFAKGCSAVRLTTVNLLLELLNRGIHPCIPEWGSVGASGDLTPSAHVALTLMGEGKVEYKGKIMASAKAFKSEGLKPIELAAKEGLALINGTTMMTGVGGLQTHDVWNLEYQAEIISALSIEGLLGSLEPFHPSGHKVKPHPGQIAVAKNLCKLLKGSKLVWDARKLEEVRSSLQKKMKENGDVLETNIPIQNTYSLRATPQILGAVRDAITYVKQQVVIEMNSANDNPLFFTEENLAYQGANFHGQPLALPMDVLSIAATEIAVLSERRLNKILDRSRNNGLSAFLAGDRSGLHCGYEGAQYIPTSLVAECRTLCNPASIQSIPSNEENQDVVSMGLVAARKAREIKNRVEYVLAVELLAACEAVEARGIEKVSPAGKLVHQEVRKVIPPYNSSRVMHESIEKSRDLIHSGKLVGLIKSRVKDLEM